MSDRLSYAEKEELPTSVYGLPERREYPMPDAAHVRAAEAYFRYCPEELKPELARAILKDAPVVLLDEATAFADAENEHQIQLAFEGLTSGKTVLMIAHRLSTIQNADRILVMKDGHIIEQGTHEELLKKQGFYANLYQSQFALG